MLLNKLVSSEKNTSVKNDKIIADDTEIAKVFKKLKITETLKTPQANHSDSNFESVRDLNLKAILKYRNQLSILAIKENNKSWLVFTLLQKRIS